MKLKTKAEMVKYVTKGKAILNDLQENPEKMEKLEVVLRENGFSDIADLAIELKTRYL